jgi:hypothetical protein
VDTTSEEVFSQVTASGLDTEEHKQQHDVGLMSAAQILMSGIVGKDDKTYTVTISGHSNPDHEPLAGWSNDFISIHVVQQGA